MTTAARRAERTFEARATVLFVILLLALTGGGYIQLWRDTQQIQRTENTLAVQQAAACQSRNASRAETNRTLLVPLRASLTYFAYLVSAAEAKEKPADRARSQAFVRRYLAYAAAAKPFGRLNCSAPAT